MNTNIIDSDIIKNNIFLDSIIALYIIIFATSFTPQIPNHIKQHSEHIISKFIFFFLVIFITNKNILVSFIISLIFTILIYYYDL
jgi:hypothetical protein